MNQMFDRYALFVSTDFFVDYWPPLASSQLSAAAISTVQSAGRATVTDFLAGESTYWNIDFSPERQQRSVTLFSNALAALSASDRVLEEIMRRNFCEDQREQANVAFALDFLHRVAHDRDFCVEAGVSFEDADVVAACLPSYGDDALDTYQLERDWLASTSRWDVMVRNLTPDLPAYTVTNFDDAYTKTVTLPKFVANVSDVLATDAKVNMLKRLTTSLERQFPRKASLAVPLVLRPPD
jgi:hypothetical protein